MGFLRWVSNIFGRGRDDPHNANHNPHGSAGENEGTATDHSHAQTRGGGTKVPEEGDDDASSLQYQHQHQHQHPHPPHPQRAVRGGGSHGGGHRRGFSMPVYMAVDNPQHAPLLVECPLNNGGVQGLDWCGQLLLMDEDGDVAHEFYEEKIMPPPSPPPSWKHPGEEEGSMTLGSHIAIEKQKQQQKKNHGEGFVKVSSSSMRPANVRRVDLRDGQARYLIQAKDGAQSKARRKA